MATTDLVEEGMGRSVGDGQRTKFWMHKWIDGHPLAQHAKRELSDSQLQQPVCEYWQSGVGWNWEALDQLLPQEVLQRIASFELNEGIEDQLAWIADKRANLPLSLPSKSFRIRLFQLTLSGASAGKSDSLSELNSSYGFSFTNDS